MTALPVTTLHAIDTPPTGKLPSGYAWEQPPAPATGGNLGTGKYAELAAALRANPGRWALLHTYPRDKAGAAACRVTAIKRGELLNLAEGFDACRRTIDGQVRVYIRYVGQEA